MFSSAHWFQDATINAPDAAAMAPIPSVFSWKDSPQQDRLRVAFHEGLERAREMSFDEGDPPIQAPSAELLRFAFEERVGQLADIAGLSFSVQGTEDGAACMVIEDAQQDRRLVLEAYSSPTVPQPQASIGNSRFYQICSPPRAPREIPRGAIRVIRVDDEGVSRHSVSVDPCQAPDRLRDHITWLGGSR